MVEFLKGRTNDINGVVCIIDFFSFFGAFEWSDVPLKKGLDCWNLKFNTESAAFEIGYYLRLKYQLLLLYGCECLLWFHPNFITNCDSACKQDVEKRQKHFFGRNYGFNFLINFHAITTHFTRWGRWDVNLTAKR